MAQTHTINSPRELTKELHDNILHLLRSALQIFQSQADVEIRKIRIRNWLFLYEGSTPTIDIIIDKGYSDTDIQNKIVPRVADTLLTLEECEQVHQFLLSQTLFDYFDDRVEIRVGTPGSEPTIHDVEDYKASVGNMIRLETWVPCDGRHKFTMILVDIFEKEGNSMAVLAEGAHRFEISLENVKSAFVLPFHPASISMKLAKNAARKKTLAKHDGW